MSGGSLASRWFVEKNCHRFLRKQALIRARKELMTLKRADFCTFYREAHSVTCLSEREKMLLGLAVAMTRNCEP